MDPSRNMAKYRNLLSAHVAHPPVVNKKYFFICFFSFLQFFEKQSDLFEILSCLYMNDFECVV